MKTLRLIISVLLFAVVFFLGCRKENINAITDFEELDRLIANEEILKFIGNNFKDLKEVNCLFNESTKALKQQTMERLTKYCFMNKVQPYRLRMIFKEFDVYKANDVPMIFEFGSNAA